MKLWSIFVIPFLCFTSLFAQQESEYVYIHKSELGTLTKNENGEYLLTLKGNCLDLIYFADQPRRTTGQQDLSSFFSHWKKNTSKKKRATTGFINYTDLETDTQEAISPDILELDTPTYNAETDTVSFKVKPLHEHEIQQGALKNIVIIYDQD